MYSYFRDTTIPLCISIYDFIQSDDVFIIMSCDCTHPCRNQLEKCVVDCKMHTHKLLLDWLPVKVRSTYKIACLCYHCHSSTAPSYVTDMLHKKPLHTRNTRSSSYTMPLLNRPAHSKATLGDRSFSFASSSVWNSIPNDVRCAPSSHHLSLV